MLSLRMTVGDIKCVNATKIVNIKYPLDKTIIFVKKMSFTDEKKSIYRPS